MTPETHAQLQTLQPSIVSLPVQGIKVHGAFKTRALKVTYQVQVTFTLGGSPFDFEVLVIPGLDLPFILGADFLRAHSAILRCHGEKFVVEVQTAKGPCYADEIAWPHSPSVTSRSLRLSSYRCAAIMPPGENNKSDLEAAIQSAKVDPIHRERFAHLLRSFQGVFSNEPGRTTVYEHEIVLTDATPFMVHQYPVPIAHRKAVDEEIANMERMGVISRASTPYSSPLMTTVKKDGSVRVCLDARRLNSVTAADAELPRPIEDLLFSLGPVKYISTIDLTASYWQVPIKPEHRKFTGFRVGTKSYCFNVLPFGLRTAVSSFTRCLDQVLGETCGDFARAYVDDIFVGSSSFDEHLEHLRKVFTALRNAGFTIRLEKCRFLRESVRFLGYVLDSGGWRPDPERIQGLQDFPTPRNVAAVQAFIGLANFDRAFVPNFSERLEPLTQLLRKNTKWCWTESQQRAFDDVKHHLAQDVLLWRPDVSQPFFVQCDASDIGVGSILYQLHGTQRRVIAYSSKLLLERERRYTVSEKELLAILTALQKWRIILLGRRFTVITDHSALLPYLKRCRLLSPRLSRWVLALQDFDFDVQHVPGKLNVVADALSRNPPVRFASPQDREFRVTAARAVGPDLRELLAQFPEAQRLDAKVGGSYQDLSAGKTSSSFMLHQKMLFKCFEDDVPPLLCVPKSLLHRVIMLYHEHYGHYGAYKTWCIMRRECWAPNFLRCIKQVLRSCQICQFAKSASLPQPQFEPILPEHPNDLVAVDFYGPLPKSVGGVSYIFVLVDTFSKLVTLFPVKRATTTAIVNRLTRDYIPVVGKPARILCDHGTQFTAKRWRETLRDLDIKLLFTSVRHPSSNPAERVMRELNRLFRTYRSQDHKSWARDIPRFQRYINQVTHESTGFPACVLHFGSQPDPLLRSSVAYPQAEPQPADSHVHLFWAYEALRRSAQRRQRKTSAPPDEAFFEIGDLVLLKANPIPTDSLCETKKFLRLFEGPYRITRRLATKTFILTNPKTETVRGQFHASHLRRFYASITS